MDWFNRRDVVKMGAAGAAGVAIAGLTTRGSGGVSAAGGTSGVHIHGTVTLVDDMPSDPARASRKAVWPAWQASLWAAWPA
jgi:hypothetical protein